MGWWRRRRPERAAPPGWSEDRVGARPRVLVEHPDPAAQYVLAKGLRACGYDVVTCGGPRAAGMGEVSCPLLRQEHCPAVDGADAVVSGLALSSGPERMVVRRLARELGERPLVLDAAPRDIAERLPGVQVAGVATPLTVDRAAATLAEVLPR